VGVRGRRRTDSEGTDDEAWWAGGGCGFLERTKLLGDDGTRGEGCGKRGEVGYGAEGAGVRRLRGGMAVEELGYAYEEDEEDAEGCDDSAERDRVAVTS
jgi:hypothetical protein